MKVPQSTAGPLTIEVDGELALVAAFTDLDGTANDETLPEADRLGSVGPAKDGFRELQSRYGIVCGPITGRSAGEAQLYARHLGIDGPVICEDGAVVLLPAGTDENEGHGFEVITSGDMRAVILSNVDCNAIDRFLVAVGREIDRAAEGAPALISTFSSPDLLQRHLGHADIAAATLSARRLASAYVVRPTAIQLATLKRRAAAWGMRTFSDEVPHIVGADVNKGLALRAVCRNAHAFFDVPARVRRVIPIVFGNAENDIPMFQHANDLGGIGVMVGRPQRSPGFWVDEKAIPPFVLKTSEPFGHGISSAIPRALRILSNRYGTGDDFLAASNQC